jgi:hypothetical protein
MTHSVSQAPVPAAHANSQAGMPMSQGAGTRTYQSFSYEPGAAGQLQPVVAPRYRMTPMVPSLRQNAAATGKFR